MYEITKNGQYHLAMDVLRTMFPMPPPRLRKCEFLFDLASHVESGVIVELGTYHGTGTIALCMGVEAVGKDDEIFVYTVDDYEPRTGWANEPYGPQDLDVFYRNIATANVNPIPVHKTTLEAATIWDAPVGLLFWDTGTISYPGSENTAMMDDVLAWEKHVVKGGKIFLRDTFAGTFGHDKIVETLADKFYKLHEEPGICILVRN